MSGDYDKGYDGRPLDDVTDQQAYNKGRNDRAEDRPRSGGGGGMGQAAADAATVTVEKWKAHPGRTVLSMIFQIVLITVVAGLIGYGVAVFAGPAWFASPTVLALQVGGVALFLSGAITWSQLLGITVGGRGTALGCLLFVGLTAGLVWMVYTYVLQAF